MGVDFLDFPRPGEKDIDAFAESRRRRRLALRPRGSEIALRSRLRSWGARLFR